MDPALNRLKALGFESAYDLLVKERQSEVISSNLPFLDQSLHGGFQLAQLTELVGEAAVGKTQFCFQSTAKVCLPRSEGGLQGSVIYIDSEGSFSSDRLKQIYFANSSFRDESYLKNVLVVRCRDHVELVGAVFRLKEMVAKQKNVKLIIVDSIAFHFRGEFDSSAQRCGSLVSIIHELLTLCHDKHLAVILTNQVTTRFANGEQCGEDGEMVAALGDTYAHMCTNRIFLSFNEHRERKATIVKSSFAKEETVRYKITPEGIRPFEAL